jgi:hypothetical protein
MEHENGKSFQMFSHDLDEVFEECLVKLGRVEELKIHLWENFTRGLSPHSLRKYLKLLPDFEDVEAEEKALKLAETHPHLGAALSFLVHWPAHDRAARLVLARADALDGNAYHLLTEAAEALSAKHPLAATLMLRAMINDTLDGAKSKRYRHAARHLAECQIADAAIIDYGTFPTHVSFVEGLKKKHGRKYGFWELVEG